MSSVEDRIAPDALTAKRVSGVGLMGDVGAEDPKCAVAYWGAAQGHQRLRIGSAKTLGMERAAARSRIVCL